jgi:hypothetical protein
MKPLLGRVYFCLAALGALGIIGAVVRPVTIVLAASPAGKATITIVSPKNGAVVRGREVTVRVAVANLVLVSSGARSSSKGIAGHLQYVLDDLETYSADQGAATSLSHAWQNVRPGKHTFIVYLANSQHLPIPSVTPGKAIVTLASAVVRPAGVPPRHTSTARRTGSPGVGSPPTTGGGSGNVTSPFNVYMLFGGLFLLAVGLLFLGRRYAFATAGGSALTPGPDNPVPEARVALEPQPASLHPSPAAEPQPASQPSPTAEADSAVEAPPPAPEPRLAAFEMPAFDPSPPPPPATPQSAASLSGHSLDFGSILQDTPAPRTDPQLDAFRASRDVIGPIEWPAPVTSVAGSGVGMDRPASDVAEISRARALEIAREWSTVMQEFVNQLEGQESERQHMLARIDELERVVRAHEALGRVLAGASEDQVTPDDLQAVQYVTDSLLRDPEHIVVLASVAQHAEQLARIVNSYARIHRAIRESGPI